MPKFNITREILKLIVQANNGHDYVNFTIKIINKIPVCNILIDLLF